ncbi:response regulator [Vallitalea guaymasensis]|uniref:response regulator n=1 Tax=Vallitalea guaymasensis TaxID=1185412 RepID=UPI000DE39A74|nr:response regulator [Vallitalea guaymasensis]
MYKIMIVDDEPIEREAFALVIKNNITDLILAGKASNGFEAIELSTKIKPDIIVMDIKMPGLTGLDAIKEIKKKLPFVKFLILSSYNEFEYAQQALKLGAEDFIVKPAKINVLVDSIKNIINKLDNEHDKRNVNTVLQNRVEAIKPIVENDTVYTIISGCNDKELNKLLGFFEVNLSSGFCMAVIGKTISEIMVNRIRKSLLGIGIKSIGAHINSMIIFFIPCSDDENEKEKYINEVAMYVKNTMDCSDMRKLVIGTGNVHYTSEGLKESYIEAVEALRTAEILDKDYIHYDSIDKSLVTNKIDINDWSIKFYDNICKGNVKSTIKMVDTFLGELSSTYQSNETSIKDKVYKLMVLLDKNLTDIIGNKEVSYELTSILEEITELSHAKELRYWMIIRMQNYIVKINDTKNVTSSKTIVLEAIDFINNNYAENITLDYVAEKLKISPYYLSKILKKHTNKNYTDIVAETRINKAKEMLSNSQYNIKEITYKTGFNTQNYFSKIFRKIVGITPTEYKNMQYEKNTEE